MIEEEVEEEEQIQEYYKYMSQVIEEKFKALTTDTMEEIRGKLKRKQNRENQEENINLIEKERNRITDKMKQHVKECFHPHCQKVDQLIILYHLFKQTTQKQDPLTLILYPNVQGLPPLETDCPEGRKLNLKMRQTHNMIAGM